jgi:ribonuclease HI
LSDGKLVARGKYDKYEWKLLQDIQYSLLTSSTVMLLGSAVQENSNLVVKNNDVEKTSIIYSDGGSRGNPGPSASAFVIMDQNEHVITDGGVYLGITTNNQAEYQAVYQALKKAVELNLKAVDFRMDSNLVVNQLNGVYKIKNRDLWPIYQDIKQLATRFEKISFSHVGRELNYLADKLVNSILDEHTA